MNSLHTLLVHDTGIQASNYIRKSPSGKLRIKERLDQTECAIKKRQISSAANLVLADTGMPKIIAIFSADVLLEVSRSLPEIRVV